ncbi:hypothetical protein [Hoeflea sp.]|uniref:hypothetical protein n=1 Tax=Hoeflea sp. TaxID=1940281 RepID=UPI003A928D93
MGVMTATLLLLVLGGLLYFWLKGRRGGGRAPGRKLLAPEQKSGIYYEITRASHTLVRHDTSNQYSKTVRSNPDYTDVFVVTKTMVKGLPPGVRALLAHSLLPDGKPDPTAVTASTEPLSDGQSTAEFNGCAGIISSSKFPNGIIKWEASLEAADGSTASLPETIEVCITARTDA